MKIKNLFSLFSIILLCLVNQSFKAQSAPVADFTLSPFPICTGAVITIQDLSTNNPTAWSYSLVNALPFPPPQVFTAQNPTIAFNFPGTYTIVLIATNASGSSSPVTKTITVSNGPNANINPANINMCLGSTSQASISVFTGGGPGGGGQNTYSWSTGSTGTQIAVSPTVTTVYTCVITATNGCSIRRTATVNVAPSTISITSVPASICPGVTSTLSANGSGPGPWTYTWSNSSNSNSITSNVATIVSATIQNANGCVATTNYNLTSSTSLSLTANSTPSAICAGNSATISVIGAANYTWSNGNTTSSVIVVSPSVATVYSVQGEIGTCSGSTSYTLVVSKIPTITVVSNPPSICAGQSTTLTASGATTYTWLPVNTTGSTIVVSPNTTSNFTVRGVNPGCAARNATVNLSVAPSPIISIFSSASVACNGDVVSLTALGANTYTWNTGTNNAVLLLTPSVTGVYSVSGTNNSGCTSSSTITITVNECTDLTKINQDASNITVFPNPSKGRVSITAGIEADVNVYNAQGQLISTLHFDAHTQSIYLENLPAGVYVIKSSQLLLNKKFVVLD